MNELLEKIAEYQRMEKIAKDQGDIEVAHRIHAFIEGAKTAIRLLGLSHEAHAEKLKMKKGRSHNE